jgi:hypothetical protein
MSERVLRVQEGLTFVATEVVVLVMVRGAGSMSARGLKRPACRRGRGRRRRICVNCIRLARKMYVHMPVFASSSPSSRREQGAGEEQGCGRERAAKASGASGGGGGENAHVVDLSSEEPNLNGARNCV